MRIQFICLVCLSVSSYVCGQNEDIGQNGRNNIIGQGRPGTHTHFTRMGTIRGTIDYIDVYTDQTTTTVPVTNNEFFSFRGIPYGTPPLGDRRWQDAELVFNWNRDIEATSPRSPCPRTKNTLGIGITEDCLYLNVFTKNLIKARTNAQTQTGSSSARPNPVKLPLKPVIVFLADYNSEGAGSFGADKLMREDLVIVTVEYRSGALGFLSDGYESLPGNYGVGDVLLALKWVQRAIDDFGGNPRQVTLAGHGQGAVLAHLLSLQASASSLFHQVILQSGTSLCQGSLSRFGKKSESVLSFNKNKESEQFGYDTDNPYYVYKKLLSYTGCSSLECLRQKSVQDIISAQRNIENDLLPYTTMFIPMIDETLRNSPLVYSPREGSQTPSAILVGSTLDEGYLIAKDFVGMRGGDLGSTQSIRQKVLPNLMKKLAGKTRGSQKELIEVVYRQYFSEISLGQSEEVIKVISQLIGDFLVDSCMRETVKFHRQGAGRVYGYVFSYATEDVQLQSNGYMQNSNIYRTSVEPKDSPVVHGSDLKYLWSLGNQRTSQSSVTQTSTENRPDEKLSKNMTNIWAEFARTGVPSPIFLLNGQAVLQNPNNPVEGQHPVWRRVGVSGPIEYYNIHPNKAEMLIDYKKHEAIFWHTQARYIEKLAENIYALKGYMVSTFTLAVLLIGSLVVLIFFLWQLKKNKQRAQTGRGYSGWLANLSMASNPSATINQCS